MNDLNDRGQLRKPQLPVLVEACWRAVGPSDTPVVCGIYQTAVGLEVHCYYGESVEGLIRSESAADINIARNIAESWLQAARAKGFTVMRSGDP